MRSKHARGRNRQYVRHLKNKKIDYADRINDFYLSKGLAYISCNVQGYDDVINPYSVEGYEDLNEDFAENVERNASYIPPEYPIVLEICGGGFTPRQQQTIRETVSDWFSLKLGDLQLSMERGWRRVRRMLLVGLLLAAVFLFVVRIRAVYAVCAAVLVLVEVFVEGVLTTFRSEESLAEDRTHAARMACIQVVFRDHFVDAPDDARTARRIMENVFTEQS